MLALGRNHLVRRTLGLLLVASAAYFAYVLWVDLEEYRDWSELLASKDNLAVAGVYGTSDASNDLLAWSVRATALVFVAWLWTMRRDVPSRLAIVWCAVTGLAIATAVLVEVAWRRAELLEEFQTVNRLGLVASALALASAVLAVEILRRAAGEASPTVAQPKLEPS